MAPQRRCYERDPEHHARVYQNARFVNRRVGIVLVDVTHQNQLINRYIAPISLDIGTDFFSLFVPVLGVTVHQ